MNSDELWKKLLDTIGGLKSLLIFIQGSPDPDVIASSYALKLICERFSVRADIYSVSGLSLPQNRAVVDLLKIPITYGIPSAIDRYDAYAVLDFQSAYVKGISERLACAVHIDHHEPITEQIRVAMKIVSDDVGSTSTLIALMIQSSELASDSAFIGKVATALVYGIQTDTDRYRHATDLDMQAINFLNPHSDAELLRKIAAIPLSDTIAAMMQKAVRNRLLYKDWVIAGIGYIDESVRDGIAIIADFLLQEEGVSASVVFAAVEKNRKHGLALDASFRTRDENLDLNYLIKKINPEGGARRFKGAFQVNLDYFAQTPEKQMLWEVISRTTIDSLKKQRDAIYIAELKGFYNRIKKRIRGLFGKEAVFFVGAAAAVALSSASCTPRFGIERGTAPVERIDVDIKKGGCALIHGRYFDVSAEAIDEERWAALVRSGSFSRQRDSKAEPRTPRIPFFNIVVYNADSEPVTIKRITLRRGGGEMTALSPSSVREKCKSLSYAQYDFDRILKNRRLLRDEFCLKQIDFDRDSVEYGFDFINPGERVSRIIAFDWIPVEYRNFVLSVEILSSKGKKVIDFDFHRFEYRKKGEVFRKGK